MDINKAIKKMLLEKDRTQTEISDRLGITRQQFNRIISRDDIKLGQLNVIAAAIGYDTEVTFIDKETGKILDV